MSHKLSLDYRTRIYDHYVNSRQTSLAPPNIEAMQPRMHLLNKIIIEHFPADKNINIFDLGCGYGAFIYACQQLGYVNTSGIDRSPEQIESANKLGIKGTTHGDLMDSLKSFPDASQDIVIAFDVIEHFTKSEVLPFVDEVYRVLKPGGKWIIHAPNGDALFGTTIRYGDFTHEMSYTKTSINQLLKSSNFTTVICKEDIPIPHGLKSVIRYVCWKVIRGLLRFYLAVETGNPSVDAIFSQNFLSVAIK
jgi:cyclopropane fatty-acyl-phospholipid synthase-like methyltransferase